MVFESNGCFVRGPARPWGRGYKQFVIELPTPMKAQMTAESLNAFMQQASATTAPIDMVLHCPSCGLQHINKDNTDDLRILAAETGRDREGDKELDRWLEDNEWTNPPHRSHLCSGCGHIWRPADVPTNGVKAVSTTGKADSPIGPSSNQTLRHVAVIAHSGGLAQLSEADALAAVRRLTLAHWDKRHDQRKAVLNALYDSHQKAAT